MTNNVQFRISSALKTIIGKELITDDFIAMFELVKNSFDAHSQRVDIYFEALSTEDAKIVVQDNGDGMDKEDIIGKWLFVAYSAKKKQQDYRDKIGGGRVFAGAKGIGRFSCDRLGERLKVYTRKMGSNGPWNVLEVDWNHFEIDPEKEFQNIPAHYSNQDSVPYDIRHGTVLEISALRGSDWSRDKLIRLRRSLERLVNPNQDNDADNFQIYLHCSDEVPKDENLRVLAEKKGEKPQEWQLVNGRVQNFVFESLELKTAQIVVEVCSCGTEIRTRLSDKGLLIYELVERSPYSKELNGVKITLFALNRSAKLAFSQRMGMRVFDYGSVFLYKNGFRINPFGDPGDDRFGIDARHLSGYFRTFGNRDLSGRIEINGPSPAFQETSSRDGGLIKNHAFADLRDLLLEIAVERLERFAIDVAKFGVETGDIPDAELLSKREVKQAIFDIISKLTRSKEVIRVEYDPNFLNILENRSAESVAALLGNLKRMAAQENSPILTREVAKAERQLKRLSKAKEEAEVGEARERERAKQAEKVARASLIRAQEAEESARHALLVAQDAKQRQEHVDTQNVFLKSVLSKDYDHILKLHHSIGQDALTIEQYVNNLLALIKKGVPLRPEQLLVTLERISFVAKQISTISRFATHANHVAAREELKRDLIEYMREYLLNVYGGMVADPYRNTIPIRFHQPDKSSFITTFMPINISMILDNLISNSRKHNVKHIDVTIRQCDDDLLVVSFADDGNGIPKRNIPHLFEIGFSTTDGSGLGLHHVRDVMGEMGGAVEISTDCKQGAEFILRFPKNEN